MGEKEVEMSDTTENIHLLRGHKTRLLRVPLRLPWDNATVPLKASPRFLPALIRIRANHGDLEVRLGPGPPLRKILNNSTFTKITYADAALLGSAALFSIYLSGGALATLAQGAELAKRHLSGRHSSDWARAIVAGSEFEVFVEADREMVVNPGPSEEAAMVFEGWLRRFGPLQKELIEALAKFKTDKRWLPDRRPRELVRAFRANNITVYPELGAEKEREIEGWLGEHLGSAACRLTRPYKRGYARAHGGLARKIHKVSRKDGSEAPLGALIFSDCKIEDRPLFYSDLGSHLEQYALVGGGGGLSATQAMASLVGGGDLIRMPLLWWGPDHRPEHPHVLFYGEICRGSRVLRATLLSIFGLLFDAAIQGLQSPTGSGNEEQLGRARLLLEAALSYLYYALSDKDTDLRTAAVTAVMGLFIKEARGVDAWSNILALLNDHGWAGMWTLAETAVFASRAPLPIWYLREIHDSPSGARLWSDISRLREGFKKVGLYG